MAKIKDAVKAKTQKVTFFSDFKAFITKGNVLDMAVGVVVGTAFNAIVNGLVKNIITPVMTYFTSGVAIDDWKYVLREAVPADEAAGTAEVAEIAIAYGLWIQAIIDFFIIALCVFAAVRFIKSMERRLNAKEIAKAEAEAAEKKAADDAKAAEAQAQADAKAAAEKAALEEFYANIREIRDSLKK
ncbi:MAG: large conductance mechanosensitive channel protein MscL [Clostridia bacterium]|nr:large conductance mechanosensitive channel protein MscL [Clostridia bacterium]